MNRLIGDRLAGGVDPGQGDDLLARLLAARDEGERALSPKEVRDEAVTLWAAGHATTSTALTWAWYLLARSRRARARLTEELDRVIGGRPPAFDDYEQLTELGHTEAEMADLAAAGTIRLPDTANR
ncbi:cytochrome P450 [Streptomyces griseochromogenes]|uniref:cytochrome P450 n=1 Tax=Streptomyces griseochromogenes TaxID=68214 RepID=UPI0037A72279